MTERFEKFTVLINRISRNIRKIKNQEMAEYNLRCSHISCLYYLYTSGGLTATDLCERCEEDKAAVSRALEYLENNGYLICESKSAKRYKSLLRLTDKGLDIGKRIADKIAYVLEEISVEMTEEERIQFYHSLMLISKGLDNIANNKNGD
ncbi:MAG: MarR family transcriptional regulator [Acutalibacteraceae bacterium]|nr:MarR family transcriptional regulator [Acutalibacteraceae bacterium]